MAILKNHLNAAASLRSEIDSMGLSQRAIDRAAKLASQEVASLSKMEEVRQSSHVYPVFFLIVTSFLSIGSTKFPRYHQLG